MFKALSIFIVLQVLGFLFVYPFLKVASKADEHFNKEENNNERN